MTLFDEMTINFSGKHNKKLKIFIPRLSRHLTLIISFMR